MELRAIKSLITKVKRYSSALILNMLTQTGKKKKKEEEEREVTSLQILMGWL